jgi:hypothetical protein
MYLFAVKSEIVQLVFYAMSLVFGGALEEMLPKFVGVGFPIALAMVMVVAARRTMPVMVVFACAAGAMEDALSGLPVATSASFFLAVAALVRLPMVPRGALMILAFPFYQLWLNVWDSGLNGSVFNRVLLAVPMGIVVICVVAILMKWLERKVAIDEEV